LFQIEITHLNGKQSLTIFVTMTGSEMNLKFPYLTTGNYKTYISLEG